VLGVCSVEKLGTVMAKKWGTSRWPIELWGEPSSRGWDSHVEKLEAACAEVVGTMSS